AVAGTRARGRAAAAEVGVPRGRGREDRGCRAAPPDRGAPGAAGTRALRACGVSMMAANVSLAAPPPFDAERVRGDFPILDTMVNGRPLVYLDSAASAPRPLAVAHVSTALGTVLPLKPLIEAAHAHGALVLIDGAQAVPHARLDVRALGADFYAFSGHKLYGPTGIGVLYGREELLTAMPPWQGGGDMMLTVSFEKTTYNELPWKFEAGTPNMSGAVGLAAAMDYLEGLGVEAIAAHEQR